MLDRIAALIPEWTRAQAADFGVSLVEALAYTADYLSYQLDAIATEAYLGTARRRVSVRRHARLVDYRHARRQQGAHLGAGAGQRVRPDARPAGTQLLTRIPALGPRVTPASPELREAMAGPIVFETMHEVELDRGATSLLLHVG